MAFHLRRSGAAIRYLNNSNIFLGLAVVSMIPLRESLSISRETFPTDFSVERKKKRKEKERRRERRERREAN